MKKIITVLSLCCLLTPAFAEKNVFFGEKINSITVYGAQSTGPGTLLKLVQPGIWDIYSQTFLMAQYSQPITFFRLDSTKHIRARWVNSARSAGVSPCC